MRKLLIALSFIFLFFSVQAIDTIYPILKTEPEFDCASPGLLNKTGFNRVLLDWDTEKISGNTCDPLLGVESGFFCDATQFSVMLSKRLDLILGDAETELLNRIDEETFTEPEINSFESLTELGVKPEIDVLLIADNYSEQFKNDFSEHFSSEFLGEKASISNLDFSNSPEQSGWFKVKLSGPLYFDGEKISIAGKVNVLFELDSGLDELDEKLGTDFSKNPFFVLPFDAPLGKNARDYGIDLKGESFYVNDEIKLENIDSPGIKLNVNSGDSFEETKAGFIALFDQSKQEEGKLRLSFNSSVPSVISMHLGKNIPHKVYYALSDSQSIPKKEEFYGELGNLLSWRIEGNQEKDSFPVLKPAITCDGWQSDIPAAEFDAMPTESGVISRHAVVFFPEKTAFSVQCISENDVAFLIHSYDGKSFEFVGEINPVKGEWLANQSLLQPNPWTGKFSLKDAVEEFKKDNACAGLLDSVSWIVWNRSELLSNVVIEETTEADYEETENEMCRLFPGDIPVISNSQHSEQESRLYWCENAESCEAQGGYHFYSPQVEPCASLGQYCCYKPVSESEQACLDSTEPMEVYLNNEPPSKEFLDKLLRAWDSPAFAESQNESMSLSEAILHFSTEDWSVVLGDGSLYNQSTKLNPLVLMAFFAHESGMASDESFDLSGKSVGNIRPREDIQSKSLCVDSSAGANGFCNYNEWMESVRHWSFHIQKNYVENGIDSVEGIIEKYAPDSENNTEAYKESVKKRVCRWQSMWEDEQAREEAIYATAIKMPDWVTDAVKKIKPPKWFDSRKISQAVEKIMFWKKDSDGDGFIDSKDDCKFQPETFNRFQDLDGCPDEIQLEQAQSGRIIRRYLPKTFSSSTNSIKNKKVLLIIPSDFSASQNYQFQQSAERIFNNFVAMSGLASVAKNDVVLLTADVLDYEKILECKAERVGTDLHSGQKSIKPITSNRNASKCAKAFFRERFGFQPDYYDYRVVLLVNSKNTIWMTPGTEAPSKVGGLAFYGKNRTNNTVFAIDDPRAPVHELGHTFGFGEQYSSKAYVAMAKITKNIHNYYPGAIQRKYSLDLEGVPWLFEYYPRNSSVYPKCSYNFGAKQTNCPEFSDGKTTDCQGRIISSSQYHDVRSVMGPLIDNKFGFDCFEQQAIINQWGRG